MADTVLFVAFPYLAVVSAVFAGIYRYRNDKFSYSSQSSQFLENRKLSWGSAPWHYGVLLILTAHLLAVVFPTFWGTLIANPIRLYILEVTGLALAVITIVGLGVLIYRRLTGRRVMAVTTVADWILLGVLAIQVILGFWVALFFRWGSDWYLHTAVPWMVSLVKFQPDVSAVVNLPWVVKLHMLGGVMFIAIFPFTRLVHIVTVPLGYLWRPYQVVIWNRRAQRKVEA